MSTAKALGNRGEAEVARYLRKKGYTLLASQWRCRFGELDLVARDRRGIVCFVEVKLRSDTAHGCPGRRWTGASRSGCAPRRRCILAPMTSMPPPASTWRRSIVRKTAHPTWFT